jgi:hypothetical protein
MNHPTEVNLRLTQHHLEAALALAEQAGGDRCDGISIAGMIADVLWHLDRDPQMVELRQQAARNGTPAQMRGGNVR